MISLTPSLESSAAVIALTENLLGSHVLTLEPARSGGNNRVYKATTESSVYAIKIYPKQSTDLRNRLGAEFSAFEFLVENGEDSIPSPVAQDIETCVGIYQWVDGEAICNPCIEDVLAAVEFIERLQIFSNSEAAQRIQPASEACFSGGEIVRQVRARFNRLADIYDSHPNLKIFIKSEVMPLLETAEAWARQRYNTCGLAFDDEIPSHDRTLSPSDFGFHNALKRKNGVIVFMDFEYFGWDDPVRLVADFLLHPGMNLSNENCDYFQKKMFKLFDTGSDGNSDFIFRFNLLFPLIGLRWCAILLNEFLPERWARRVFAEPAQDREYVHQQQLDKAHYMIGRVQNALEGNTHGK
jgi:hypothetical protein